jgi:hypothetical protein
MEFNQIFQILLRRRLSAPPASFIPKICAEKLLACICYFSLK